VEVPVTIMPTYSVTRRVRWLREHWQARPLRLARRASRLMPQPQPLWLRPRPEYALGDLQALLLAAERAHLPFAVLMFHSSELLAGASPYRQTEGDVDALLRLLDGFFAWSLRRGHEFCTLTAAGRILGEYAGLPVKEL
jgi:hypothetical protein